MKSLSFWCTNQKFQSVDASALLGCQGVKSYKLQIGNASAEMLHSIMGATRKYLWIRGILNTNEDKVDEVAPLKVRVEGRFEGPNQNHASV